MEVNKGEAERCRDMGAAALRSKQYQRSVKLLQKSQKLYPLPGVEVLLEQAKRKLQEGASANANGASASRAPPQRSESNVSTGADGRSYSEEQVRVVKQVLRSKEGGRGAHYRVLGITDNATENDIKRAYRKLALKLHPDKNSAPHADEAFKAVGLAYATLSDTQKRSIYDRYGEEDPDNRGGGGQGGMQRGFHGQQEVSPEDIFNMFFGGGMPGHMRGGPGFHVYSNGFGGGFGPGMNNQRPRARRRAGGEQEQEEVQGMGAWMQLIPFLVLMLLSFMNVNGGGTSTTGNRYFSLTRTEPFLNQLHTKLTPVKDIPYFVTDKFLRTYYRDRYQLGQVERMVQKTYQEYLTMECKKQQDYQKQLRKHAMRQRSPDVQARHLKKANEFELSRCIELEALFPTKQQQRAKTQQQQQQHAGHDDEF